MQLSAKYMTFYLDGRGDDLFDDDDIDLDDLIEKAWKGGDPRELAIGVVKTLAARLRVEREKRQWLRDNEDAIKEAGGDSATAFDHYVQGRIDQHAHQLEDEIVTGMFEERDDEDEEDDDDDDDEEDDEAKGKG